VAGAAALGFAVGAVAWLAAPLAIRFLFSPDYLEGIRALRILSAGLGIVFAIWILHAVAMSVFNARLLLQTTVVSLIVNVALNLWLIPLWHRDGAAAATVGGELVAFAMLALGLRRTLNPEPNSVIPSFRHSVVPSFRHSVTASV
jgi:O-antigen/teichoic acid export membrane protein